jgi:hypothetical protein
MIHEKLVGFPSCYVVNLEECTDRAEYMAGEFDKLGITDYHIMSYPRIENSDLKFKYSKECEKVPRGATSSHLLTIKHWYENTDEEMVAIFEDDCDFSQIEKWPFVFKDYIKRFGALWDCLQLCVMHEGWAIMYPRGRNNWDHGLQCYIVKRGYAKKLIDYYFEDDKTINFRLPNIYAPANAEVAHDFIAIEQGGTIENTIYGLGRTYIHPLFNHNVMKFPTTIHTDAEPLMVAHQSYQYVNTWWERVGQHATLDQLFTFDYCCPPGQTYGFVVHVDT